MQRITDIYINSNIVFITIDLIFYYYNFHLKLKGLPFKNYKFHYIFVFFYENNVT